MSGALFAFATSFDEIVVALFLASPQLRTLPRQIFSGVSETISPTITAAAVVLLLVRLGRPDAARDGTAAPRAPSA